MVDSYGHATPARPRTWRNDTWRNAERTPAMWVVRAPRVVLSMESGRETCKFSLRSKCASRHVPNSFSSVDRHLVAGGGNLGSQPSTESKMRRPNLEATMPGASGQVAPNSRDIATLSVSHSLLPHAASSKMHARQAVMRYAAIHPCRSMQRTCQSWRIT